MQGGRGCQLLDRAPRVGALPSQLHDAAVLGAADLIVDGEPRFVQIELTAGEALEHCLQCRAAPACGRSGTQALSAQSIGHGVHLRHECVGEENSGEGLSWGVGTRHYCPI